MFSRVAEAFDREFPEGSRYGEMTTTPASFPALLLWESDNYFYEPELDASWVVYDVEVYSNRVSGAKQECNAIMNLVDGAMHEFGKWQRLYCTQSKNEESRIYRMVARYRGVAVKETEDTEAIRFRIYRK